MQSMGEVAHFGLVHAKCIEWLYFFNNDYVMLHHKIHVKDVCIFIDLHKLGNSINYFASRQPSLQYLTFILNILASR